MMQKRNLYSCLIDKGKSREQLPYQDILSVKVSNQKRRKTVHSITSKKFKNNLQIYLQKFLEAVPCEFKDMSTLAKALNELSKFDKLNPSTKNMYRRISVLQYHTRTDYQVLFSSPNLWY